MTAFATIKNAGTVKATNCSIQLPAGVPANFKYQTPDPATNAPTGTANTPVDIAGGAAQTFYFALTPTTYFSQDIPLGENQAWLSQRIKDTDFTLRGLVAELGGRGRR